MRHKIGIWERLKDYKCPFCNGDMRETQFKDHECTECSFFIRQDRLTSLINKLLNPPKNKSRRAQEDETQEALNNL